MLVTPSALQPALYGAVECTELVGLAAILAPDVHVAVWRRSVEARILGMLARPDCRFQRSSRTVIRSLDPTSRTRIAELLPRAANDADPVGAAALADDMWYLSEAFAELVAADELLVSLEVPEAATCPRFHVDRVGIRMLVTYAGPGTEWLPHEHVDRRWLGDAGHGRLDEETGLLRPVAQVQHVPPFAVVLLKGEAWPGAQGFGAVHRSPDPAGRRRVLLRVDMLSQCVGRDHDHDHDHEDAR